MIALVIVAAVVLAAAYFGELLAEVLTGLLLLKLGALVVTALI